MHQPPTIEDAQEWIARAIDAFEVARVGARLDAEALEALKMALVERTAQNIVCGRRPPWPKEPI